MKLDPIPVQEECECGEFFSRYTEFSFSGCNICKRRFFYINDVRKRNFIRSGTAIPESFIEKYLSTIPSLEIFEDNFHELILLERSLTLSPINAIDPVKKIVDMFFEINKIHELPFVALNPYSNQEYDGLAIFKSSVKMILDYERKGLLIPEMNILSDYTRRFFDALINKTRYL